MNQEAVMVRLALAMLSLATFSLGTYCVHCWFRDRYKPSDPLGKDSSDPMFVGYGVLMILTAACLTWLQFIF